MTTRQPSITSVALEDVRIFVGQMLSNVGGHRSTAGLGSEWPLAQSSSIKELAGADADLFREPSLELRTVMGIVKPIYLRPIFPAGSIGIPRKLSQELHLDIPDRLQNGLIEAARSFALIVAPFKRGVDIHHLLDKTPKQFGTRFSVDDGSINRNDFAALGIDVSKPLDVPQPHLGDLRELEKEIQRKSVDELSRQLGISPQGNRFAVDDLIRDALFLRARALVRATMSQLREVDRNLTSHLALVPAFAPVIAGLPESPTILDGVSLQMTLFDGPRIHTF